VRRPELRLCLGSPAPPRSTPVPEVQRRRQGAFGLRTADHAPALRDLHSGVGAFPGDRHRVASANRERFLRSLDRDKQRAKLAAPRREPRAPGDRTQPLPLPSGGGPIAEDVAALWEGWMRHVDELLADERLVELVFDALARAGRTAHPRAPRHACRCGAAAAGAQACAQLEFTRRARARGRANLVYRQFTHVGAGKVPMQRRWAGSAWHWGQRWSSGCTNGW